MGDALGLLYLLLNQIDSVVGMSQQDDYIFKMQGMGFARGDRYIFKRVDVGIRRGKVTAIMGPSGTGKTTFLQLLSRQLSPKHGTIHFDGIELSQLKRSALYRLRNRMGMLFQQGALFTDLNVYENVAFALREHTNLPEDMIRDLVLLKLQAVGLRGVANSAVSALSGGMARRVALARAIMMDPEVMMYDEPFTGQDPISKGVLLKLIRELNDALNLTSIVVTHDVKETLNIADEVIILSQGGILAQGSPQQLRDMADPSVHQFINGLPDGEVPFHYPAQPLAEDLGL